MNNKSCTLLHGVHVYPPLNKLHFTPFYNLKRNYAQSVHVRLHNRFLRNVVFFHLDELDFVFQAKLNTFSGCYKTAVTKMEYLKNQEKT